MSKLTALLYLFLFLNPFSFPQEITGTWELVYIPPIDMMDTEPRGITNVKLFFREDGKVFTMLPDEEFSENISSANYKLSNDSLVITSNGNEEHIYVMFPDAVTIKTFDEYGGYRIFKKINEPDAEKKIIEPKSIQFVNTGDSLVTQPDYDTADYTSLPLLERVPGVWEAISYENVPQQEMPPYGFLNDIWTFNKSSLTMRSRTDEKDATAKYIIADSSIILTTEDGITILWNLSFNRWGHMVIGNDDGIIVLKLVTKDLDQKPKVPLKVALLKLKGEE